MPDQTSPEAEILFRSGATVTNAAQLWIRNRIGISTIQAVGNANTAITAGTTTVRLSASLTAARIYTLPNPASYADGETLVFTDTIGSLTTANTATLSAGAGTVNGVVTLVLSTPYASPILISNGVDKWTLNTLDTINANTLTGTTLASGVTASSLLSAAGGAFNTGAFNPLVTRATLSLATTDAPTFAGLTAVGASAASAPAVRLTGAVFTGGTGTTTTPHFLIEPTGTTATTTWSTSGTLFGINGPSGFAGNLLEIRINGGPAIFQLTSSGTVSNLLNIQSTSGSVLAQTSIGIISRGGLRASADGVFQLRNNANSAEGSLTLGGLTSTGASLSAAPAVRLTGAIFNGGTGTTTTPHWLIEPTGTTAATTWSTAGTQFGINAATGFAGNFLDLRVAGVAMATIASSGSMALAGNLISYGAVLCDAAQGLGPNGRSRWYSSADGEFEARNVANSANANLTFARGTATGASLSAAPAVRLTGAIFTGGTGTTTTPHWLIEPTGTTAATTWNTAGTQFGINAATGFTGNFLDFRTGGGSSVFSVSSGGSVNASGSFVSTINIRAGATSRLEINGRGGIGASADGVFQLRNWTNEVNGSLTMASLSATSASTMGDAASTSEQLTILGGANGGPMLKLSRTSGAVISYDWNLAGNALNFRDSTSGVNMTVMQLTAATSIPTIVAGADLGAGVGTTPTGGLIRSAHTGTGVTDASGANLTISSGRGTGAGAIPSILFQTYNTTGSGTTLQTATTKMTLLGNGNFGIAQSTPTEKLHVTGNILASGSVTSNTLVRAGADLSAILPAGINASMTSTGQDWAFIGSGESGISNSVDKQTRIGGLHYTAGEEPVTGMYVFSTATASSVLIGGGTSLGNAATIIEFFTTPNNTTTYGLSRWNINNAGHFVSSFDNAYDIGGSGSARVRSLYAGTSVVVENGGFVAAASTGSLRIASRVHLNSSADGILCLNNSNTASPDFNRLTFGGTTSACPAIARDGAGVKIVGGDGTSVSWIKVPPVTVASLPAAATAGVGARSFVTDALTPTFGSALSGGGAVPVPVYSTGSAWNVG